MKKIKISFNKNRFWILVIIWAGLIFIMSSKDTNNSNTKSKGTLNELVEKTVETTNGLGITD